MRYYARFNAHNMHKNKLQKAIINLFKLLDGYIVSELHLWKDGLEKEVKRLNALHCKCQPITITSFEINNGIGFSCGDAWTCQIYLYKIHDLRIHNMHPEAFAPRLLEEPVLN